MKRKILFALMIMLASTLVLSSCGDDDDDDDVVLTGLEKAKDDYQKLYVGSAISDPSWTGSTTGCNQGDISANARAMVVQRVNYYRALVGLPANITLNSSQNQKCQEAALYMIANQTLTHYPSASGLCYTAGADDAAGHGNIAYSKGYPGATANHSVNAVSGYIEDPGAGNERVGHRSWILYPQLSAIGSGSVWRASDSYATDCMMWGDNLNGAAPTVPYVAYPPADYIPSTLLFPRWSFSIQGGNFNNANVTMTDASGNAVPLNVIFRSAQQGAPDAIIVWEPQVSVSADTEFNITVSGITGASQSSYTYTTKVFWEGPLPTKRMEGGQRERGVL